MRAGTEGQDEGEISGSGGPLPSRSSGSVTMKSFPDNSYALIRNTSTTSTRSTNGRSSFCARGMNSSAGKPQCPSSK
jgi:hypothetical protein